MVNYSRIFTAFLLAVFISLLDKFLTCTVKAPNRPHIVRACPSKIFFTAPPILEHDVVGFFFNFRLSADFRIAVDFRVAVYFRIAVDPAITIVQ